MGHDRFSRYLVASLSTPLGSVKTRMSGFAQNHQVLWSVVPLLVVDVVDFLARAKVATNSFLSNKMRAQDVAALFRSGMVLCHCPHVAFRRVNLTAIPEVVRLTLQVMIVNVTLPDPRPTVHGRNKQSAATRARWRISTFSHTLQSFVSKQIVGAVFPDSLTTPTRAERPKIASATIFPVVRHLCILPLTV
jgi:hypothetical protein